VVVIGWKWYTQRSPSVSIDRYTWGSVAALRTLMIVTVNSIYCRVQKRRPGGRRV